MPLCVLKSALAAPGATCCIWGLRGWTTRDGDSCTSLHAALQHGSDVSYGSTAAGPCRAALACCGDGTCALRRPACSGPADVMTPRVRPNTCAKKVVSRTRTGVANACTPAATTAPPPTAAWRATPAPPRAARGGSGPSPPAPGTASLACAHHPRCQCHCRRACALSRAACAALRRVLLVLGHDRSGRGGFALCRGTALRSKKREGSKRRGTQQTSRHLRHDSQQPRQSLRAARQGAR